MKRKFLINIRFFLTSIVAIGCIGLSGAAFAENPSKSKSDKGAKLSSADKAFIKDAAKRRNDGSGNGPCSREERDQ